MEVIEIGPDTIKPNTLEWTLHGDFARAAKLNAKVFTLRVCGVRKYEFSTTSGDLFMTLGRLSEQGREDLAILLEENLIRVPRVLFRVRLREDEEGKYRGMMFVTFTMDSDIRVFHCSPAH